MRSFEARYRNSILKQDIIKVGKTVKFFKIAAVFSISIAVLSLIAFWFIFYFGNKKDYNYLLDIGTISGGLVSSLFSLSGLLLVYIAFLGQREQLLYQQIDMLVNKEELKLTRDELANQQREMKQQNDTLKIQQFENTFFNLLSNYQKNISLFYVNESKNIFKTFFKRFENSIPENNSYTFEILQETLKNVKYTLENTFDYTFLYQLKSIIQILNNSNVISTDYYVEILMGQLSQYEKSCIYIIVKYDVTLENDVKSVFIDSKIFEKYNSNLVSLQY